MALNPFEQIDQRLTQIERLLIDLPDMLNPHKGQAEQMEFISKLPDRLKSSDLKKVFGISSVTIWKWTKKGLLKPLLINNRNYYLKKDVLELLGEKKKGKK